MLEIVHDGRDDDVYGLLGWLGLDVQNWECPQWVLDALRGSYGEIFRGLILIVLNGHAMVSRGEIHPSDLHVLGD